MNSALDLALSALIAYLNNAQAVSNLIANARAQNRDLTHDELHALLDSADSDMSKLVADIAKAKAARR